MFNVTETLKSVSEDLERLALWKPKEPNRSSIYYVIQKRWTFVDSTCWYANQYHEKEEPSLETP